MNSEVLSRMSRSFQLLVAFANRIEEKKMIATGSQPVATGGFSHDEERVQDR